MKAEVFVTLKKEVLDPQGDAVRRALDALGFEGVSSVRIGKYIEVALDHSDSEKAKEHLDTMCQKLLANPVIEDFRFQLADD